MNKEEIIKELQKLKKESKDYSHYELKNEGYRVAMMDAIDLVKNLTIPDVVGRSEQLQAVEDLKDLCYDVCPLDRRDDLSEIVARL